MTEVSGQPIVNKSDSVIATYLKPQDYFMNPPTTGPLNLQYVQLNARDATPSSGGLNQVAASGIVGSVNIANSFTTSGRTITAAGSGIFAPLGFFAVQVSGNTVVVPYFTP